MTVATGLGMAVVGDGTCRGAWGAGGDEDVADCPSEGRSRLGLHRLPGP